MKLTSFLFGSKVEAAEPAFEVAAIAPDELAAELTEVRKEIDQTVATHAAELAARQVRLDTAEARVSELEASATAHAEQLTVKDAEVAEANESADERANAILAQAGHEPVKVEDDPGTMAAKSELGIYEAMEGGAEKRTYLMANKTKITAQAKAESR